jgi:hypothetical protein
VTKPRDKRGVEVGYEKVAVAIKRHPTREAVVSRAESLQQVHVAVVMPNEVHTLLFERNEDIAGIDWIGTRSRGYAACRK